MSCFSPLWTLASSCWDFTKGTFTLEVNLLTPEEVQLSYLLFIFFKETFSRLRIWECAGPFGTYHLVRMHAGKITPKPLQRWPTRTPSCGLLRTSQAGKEAQLPFSLQPFVPGDCLSVVRCCLRLEACPRDIETTWYPCCHLEPPQSQWSRLEA